MKSIFEFNQPAKITLLEATGEYREIPLGAFVSMLDADSWSEKFVVPRELSDAYDKACLEESFAGATLFTPRDLYALALSTSLSYVKFCAFVDRRSQGFGFDVVARTTIPAGRMICTYGGEVFKIETKPMAPYAIGINKRLAIDAENSRCLGSMFAHLPSEGNGQLANPDDAKDVAFANLGLRCCVSHHPVSQKPQIFFLLETLREILPGEIMGWDYGVKYWKHHPMEPHLFTRTGAIIEPTPPFKTVRIHVTVPGGEGFTHDINRDIIKDLKQTEGRFGFLSSDGRQLFAETTCKGIYDAYTENPQTNSITVMGAWIQSNSATEMLLLKIMDALSMPIDAEWTPKDNGETACLSMPQDDMESLRKIESAFRAFNNGPDALEISIETGAQTISIGLHNITLAKLQQIQQCITTKSSPLPRAFFDTASLTQCHETGVVKKLNQSSGLTFRWGHVDCNVHAYVEVDSPEKLEQCQGLQQQLPSQFCRFFGTPRPTLFVLHNVNDPSNTRGIFNAFP